MSKIALSGNASGTGTLTIAAPNTNTNRTLSLPDEAGNVVLDSATQTLTNKTLTSPTVTTPTIDSAQVPTVSGTAPLYMCRAWVNFNGTGTVAIRASGNVSSITDNGAGDYTINFTTAMPDANYAASAAKNDAASQVNGHVSIANNAAPTASALRIACVEGSGPSLVDSLHVHVAIFR
jgi:hypothetical protein